MYHLLTNLRGYFSSGWSNNQHADLGELFKACVYAPTQRLFHENIDRFIGGPMEADQIAQLPVENWAVAYSPNIIRYREMTSNAAESFNNWLVEVRCLLVTKLCDWILSNIARWFVEWRKECEKWITHLVPKRDSAQSVACDVGRSWVVHKCSGGDYEVLSDISCTVDLTKRTCSCHVWQTTGFPCAHAAAVISKHCNSIYTHIDECYFTKNYQKTYKSHINPIPQTLRFECNHYDKSKKNPPTTVKTTTRTVITRNQNLEFYI